MLGCQGACHRTSILIIQKRNPRQISSKTKIKHRSLCWRFNQHASNIKRKFCEKIRATLRLLWTFEEISAEVLWSVCQNPPRFLLCTVCLLKKGQNHMLKNKKKHRGTWYGCRMHCFMLCEQQQKKMLCVAVLDPNGPSGQKIHNQLSRHHVRATVFWTRNPNGPAGQDLHNLVHKGCSEDVVSCYKAVWKHITV